MNWKCQVLPNVSAPLTTLKGQQAPLSFDLFESKRSTNGEGYFLHNSTIDVVLLGCQGTDVYGFISMCNCAIQLFDHLQWIMVLLIHSGFSLTPKLCQGSCFGVAYVIMMHLVHLLHWLMHIPCISSPSLSKLFWLSQLLLLFVLVYAAFGAHFGLHYWRIIHLVYKRFITGV